MADASEEAEIDQRFKAFGSALERLVGLAGLMVSVADDDPRWRYPDFARLAGAQIRHGFMEADKAAWYVTEPPWRTPRVTTPKSGPITAGLIMYGTALRDAWFRWGARITWFKVFGPAGQAWQGRLYPLGFPDETHSITPRELEMLRVTFKFVQLPPSDTSAESAAMPDSDWIYWSLTQLPVALGSSKGYRKKLDELQAAGEIRYEKAPGNPPKSRGWRMIVFDPDARADARKKWAEAKKTKRRKND